MRAALLLDAFREAVLTLAAALVAMGGALWLDPEPAPAVLAVVLTLSLSRSHLDRSWRERLEAALVLPVVGIGALGIGWLLKNWPWLGAAAFTAAMSGSIWLRRFGPAGRKAGTLIALPCLVLLVVPHVHAAKVGPAMQLALPVLVAVFALVSVSAFHALGLALGWRDPPGPAVEPAMAPASNESGVKKLPACTRMALQMAAALAVAFVVGYLAFGTHWAWIVLTAYIVGSGNQGRLDVAYKSVQRVLGAAAGTVAALAASYALGAAGTPTLKTAALILAAVFLGLWLRPISYAWWALFITVALALLQGFEGASVPALLGARLLEILIGALIGVAAAWLVLPVRSTDVLRRRMAEALAALSDAADPAKAERSPQVFIARLHAVRKVGAAFRASRSITQRWWQPHPADWVDALQACADPAVAMIERGEPAPGAVRKAIGAARKAMREPAEISAALSDLQAALTRA